MALISESEIKNLKILIDLVSLCHSRNIPLKKTGKNYLGKCPFHDDDKASFTVNPAENLFHCFGCNTGGDVIRFVELLDRCTFPQAVATLQQIQGHTAVKTAVKEEMNYSFSSRESCPQMTISSLDRSKLLSLVADFYHAAFNQRKDGKEYLAKRGITDPSLLSRFKAGFCAGSIRDSMPKDGNMLEELKVMGVITKGDREFFKNCVVFPISDMTGRIVNLYGRRIRNGPVNHLYLPGPKQGVFNQTPLKLRLTGPTPLKLRLTGPTPLKLRPAGGAANQTSDPIIFVESILDALALIQAGYPGAIPCFGSTGIPDQILNELKKYPDKSVFLCFDADDAGRSAAVKARLQLEAAGIAVSTVSLPDGHDPCSVLQESNGKSILKQLMRQAGGKTRIMGSNTEIKPTQTNFNNGNAVFTFSDLMYELRGVFLDPTRSKVTIKVKRVNGSPGLFLDTVDLYSARSRSLFARSVAETFGAKDSQISAELLSIIEPLDKYKEESGNDTEAATKPAMTDEEKQAALSFLTAPDIFDCILNDFETVGITGEETNKLVGYIAAVSRKLSKPISVCIQSRSAAGKSALQDAILNFVPPEDTVRYTRLTGQALFYKETDSLKHKILALEEDVGALAANYALRALQSSQNLSSAAAGRDPQTGKLRTDDHNVEGPTPVFMTTTAPELESETGSRFLKLTIDESVEATRRIHEMQREMDTLEGLYHRKTSEKIIKLHHNAQRLLEDGLQVINPYARELEFHTEVLGSRRDHPIYLGLIKAIAYLLQYQREIKEMDFGGETIRYVEVTLDDIRKANQLASEVLGRSLDELSPPSRQLLGLIRDMVMKRSDEADVPPGDYPFSRREIRDYAGWSHAQVKRHIGQLEELEYIYPVSGRRGKEYVYELRYEDELDSGKKFFAGLVDVDKLEKRLNQQKDGKR